MPGFVEAVDGCVETELAGALGHAEALAWCDEWRGVEVVIVDAADERLDGDQFPGVAVVRRIRACQIDDGPTIIVVTGHYLHDGLRHRMAQAGADFFFFRRDLHTAERLLDVVLHPERYRRGVPHVADAATAHALGVDDGARIEQVVAYVDEHGLAPALDPDPSAREEPRSRKWVRHRRAIAEMSGLEAVNLTTSTAPRGSRWPSIRQIRRLWAWAARVQRPETGAAPGVLPTVDTPHDPNPSETD